MSDELKTAKRRIAELEKQLHYTEMYFGIAWQFCDDSEQVAQLREIAEQDSSMRWIVDCGDRCAEQIAELFPVLYED